MYEYKRTTLVKYFVSFNFVKHWLTRNLFNDKIFPTYGNMQTIYAYTYLPTYRKVTKNQVMKMLPCIIIKISQWSKE